MTLHLDDDGYCVRDGARILPRGFNYWPPESGTACWTDAAWSLAPFQRDFQAMTAMGFNCARIFLRWPEFQPAEDAVDATALTRLAAVGAAARDAGLLLIPTLFVGFMSGGLYPPPWLGTRNLFTDPACIRAAGLLATEAARVLASTGAVLAYDLSNEINVWCNHLPAVTAEEAIAWQRAMVDAIQAGHPGALVMNGTNHTGVVADVPWSVREQARVPMDLLSMHVYPVRTWNPLKLASLQAYEADILAPVHVAMARAFGPVMLQEFGVALPLAGRHARNYLFQSVIGCWLAGSNGFLQWGWQDFQTRGKPYRDNPFEKELCFLDGNGAVKEMGRGFLDALAFIAAQDGCTPETPEIAIYLGDAYWEGPYATQEHSIRCTWLSTALRRAHLAHAFTEQIDPRFRVIVVPGPRLNLDEIAALQAYVAGGGRVLLADIGISYWCDDLKALAGLELVDMAHLSGDTRVCSDAVTLPVPAPEYIPVAEPRGGRVLATLGADEIPAVLVAGDGRVATLFLPVGEALSEHPARLAYQQLLAPIFTSWGIAPTVAGLPPEVEARALRHADGARRLVLLNHGTQPVEAIACWEGQSYPVTLTVKGATVLYAKTSIPATREECTCLAR
jgi:hypothetical protein